MQDLQEEARLWVKNTYKNADHLLRAEEWLLRLDPDASEAAAIATVTHDMERAFPGPDSPKEDFSGGAIDRHYYQAHAERSAKIVSTFLQEHGASEELIEKVAALIIAHEDGGWPEANLVQAADSLSLLEVNIDLFLHFLQEPATKWTRELVRQKFHWMYERIQIAEARKQATPLYNMAMQKLDMLDLP
jgi:hypothetical protein